MLRRIQIFGELLKYHQFLWQHLSRNESYCTYCLKVYKNGNFFGSDFEFCTTSLCLNIKILGKLFVIGPLWGELRLVRVVLRLRGTKKIFKIGQIFFVKSYMTLLYLPIIDFPKFDKLTATGMVLCVNLWPKEENNNKRI
jgi:hypothetical protein